MPPIDPQDTGLLSRIDERTRNMAQQLDEVKKSLTVDYVTQDEFGPIKTIVYGIVGSILLSFIGAVIALVINGGGGHK